MRFSRVKGVCQSQYPMVGWGRFWLSNKVKDTIFSPFCQPMAERIFHTTQLLSKTVVADQVIVLQFVKPEGFQFQPGQFLQFRVPEGEGFVLRSYSISSAPHDLYLEFCIKILEAGKGSTFFSQLKVGHSAQVSDPRGLFTVKPEHLSSKVFIATGTGLAPVMSMITSLAYKQVSQPVHTLQSSGVSGTTIEKTALMVRLDHLELLFGVRTEADLFWIDRFENIPALKHRATISRPVGSWDGLVGRVTDHLTPDVSAEYYICGNLEMVKDIRSALTAAGVPLKQIHFEIF